MMTKTKLLATTAAILMTVFASSGARADFTTGNNLSDLYVGGFGGWNWLTSDVSGGASSFDTNGNDWGLFVGYNFGAQPTPNNFAVQYGIEGHYAWASNDSITGIANGVATSLEKKHEWGVDFKPGVAYMVPDEPVTVKPYAILGYRQAAFDNSQGGNDSHPGFALGLGTEVVTYQHFGIRADYDHVFYKNDGGVNPDEDDLRLGVVYHF